MNETACMYTGNREETLVAYLYDEISPTERRAFESHLAGCGVCRAELSEFGVVRARLGAWGPPEPSRALTAPPLPSVNSRQRVLAALHDVPVWMQAAAAMLFLGLSAGVANLDVNYTADGFSIHTGWWAPTAPSTPVVAAMPSVDPVSRDELSGQIRKLREELGSTRTPDADLVRRVRLLIADSERKQENELALRAATLLRDVRSQRAADMAQINRAFQFVGAATDLEIRRQQQRTEEITTQLASLSKP
jgi:hypothetical protein